jgi:hypothetical protein
VVIISAASCFGPFKHAILLSQYVHHLELRDLIVTPVVIILVYGVAYAVRPLVTDQINRIYLIPALTVKIVGALAVGFIYQFYYAGGDTFNYHTHGSRHIWNAFMDSPPSGLRLILSNGSLEPDLYKYSSKMAFFNDPASYLIVRIAGVLDIFTFSSYSATAVLFAVFSFVGMWLFFLTFYRQYPHLHLGIAFAAFFIPSVFFWGSGLLKDTITLGLLGMATYSIFKIFILKEPNLKILTLLLCSLYGLYTIKIYILLTFLPAAILWAFVVHLRTTRSVVLRMVLFPFVISIAGVLAYYAMVKASEDNAKYSIDNIARTAQITAYDIRYQTGRDAGSGYDLGKLDGTLGSMMALAPQAINVSLFRPYLWEVSNPLMLLSGLESSLLLLYCIYIIITKNLNLFKAIANPDVFFALIFALTFAFAVGVSTFNFGTLARYKIPMLPFFVLALILIQDQKSLSDEEPANE